MSVDQPSGERPSLAELHMTRQAAIGEASGARLVLDAVLIGLHEMCRRHRQFLPPAVADAVTKVDDALDALRVKSERVVSLSHTIEEHARRMERSERDRLDRVERER